MMAIMSIIKLCCCVLLVLLVLCGQKSNALQHLCGKALPQALEVICVNGFRSIALQPDENEILADYDNYNEILDEQREIVPYPYSSLRFLAKINGGSAAGLLAKTRRRVHGIYDECCTKGCTMSELTSYCL